MPPRLLADCLHSRVQADYADWSRMFEGSVSGRSRKPGYLYDFLHGFPNSFATCLNYVRLMEVLGLADREDGLLAPNPYTAVLREAFARDVGRRPGLRDAVSMGGRTKAVLWELLRARDKGVRVVAGLLSTLFTKYERLPRKRAVEFFSSMLGRGYGFFRHAVDPRLWWLVDLGFIQRVRDGCWVFYLDSGVRMFGSRRFALRMFGIESGYAPLGFSVDAVLRVLDSREASYDYGEFERLVSLVGYSVGLAFDVRRVVAVLAEEGVLYPQPGGRVAVSPHPPRNPLSMEVDAA